MRLKLVALHGCLVALLFSSCARKESTRESSNSLSSVRLAPSGHAAVGRFTAIGANVSGIDFSNRLFPKNNRKYVYNGSGIAAGDIDGNGLPDLYFTALDASNRLYLQREPFVFEDITAATKTGSAREWSTGASFIDYDNDGDLDLYVCNLRAANLLFRNDGKGNFEEVAREAGLAYVGASVMAAFADADRDGDLDLYLLTNRVFAAGEEAPEAKVRLIDGVPTVHPDFVEQYSILSGKFIEGGQADLFYTNNGDGTFSDTTKASGISGYNMGLSVTWWDFDDDGWPDIYVANDMKGPDRLYRNQGDGTFKDVAEERLPHTSWFSMGSDAADINNDGRLDFLTGDMSATNHFKQKTTMGAMSKSRWFLESAKPPQYMRNTLLLNTGTERFMEIAHLAGLASTNWTWTVRFGDLDNDGWVDLFVTNGNARNANQADLDEKARRLLAQKKRDEALAVGMALPPLPERNLAYRNTGDLAFEPISKDWGLDQLSISHGAAMVDLDRDGDLDLAVSNLNKTATIYRNDIGEGRKILVRLRGDKSNVFGLGARVEIRTVEGRQIREMHHAHGYLSSDEPVLHFGLGPADKVETLSVAWPSGQRQSFSDLEPGRLYTVSESSGRKDPKPKEVEKPRWFDAIDARSIGLSFMHKERPFEDYDREPLLPAKLSQEGPGLSLADLNGDGRDDVVIGGAAGQKGAAFLQIPNARFERSKGPWERAIESEDQGVVVFDANADGRQDLFFASGSNEFKPASAELRDRLYLADSNGGYREAPKAAFRSAVSSSGPVAAADIDRDGDLDLFVGGSTKPGTYPVAEKSRLWVNVRGRYRDGTRSKASGFNALKAVRGARFADMDNDGWVDLLLATEWGPVHYFKNENGTFVDKTESAGLARYKGFWNGVEAADFDNDGDLDFVATNRGLNTKYKGSVEDPVTLLVRDFDEDGTVDLVEIDSEGGEQYPSRGLSCSSSAMPFVKEEFPTYDSFARASLEDVYGADKLSTALRYEATHLAHTVFINDGTGVFSAHSLPRHSQASVGYGVVVADFDADGGLDIFIANNSFAPQAETGRFDGGLGTLLRGIGDGTFEYVSAAESGISLPDDAKAVAVGDLNADGVPDLVVTTNNGAIKIFQNRGSPSRHLRVRLRGSSGNPDTIGAQVTLITKNDVRLLKDVSAGGGYLSQSSATIVFALPNSDSPKFLVIRWPDGSTSTRKVSSMDEIEIRQPIDPT